MKILLRIILLTLFVPAAWFMSRTGKTATRSETVIDLNWRFTTGDPEGASCPGYDDSQWKYVTLPHDREEGGVGWYRKSLEPVNRKDEQFYLLLEGPCMNADVYFNGVHLGRQENGNSGFCFDITRLVRKDTTNVIAVRNDCRRRADQVHSMSGICSHAKLISAGQLHFPVPGQALTSSVDSSGTAELIVSLELSNKGSKCRRFEVICDIRDPDGHLVAEGRSSEFLEAGNSKKFEKRFTIENPMLWSPDTPGLYEVKCYLADRNREVDQLSISHGIRTADFDTSRGFVLNGKKLRIEGVCLQHEAGDPVTAIPLEKWRRRLAVLKELGVNALRLPDNPHLPELRDLCDRMGFLVIDQEYDKWEPAGDEMVVFTNSGKVELYRNNRMVAALDGVHLNDLSIGALAGCETDALLARASFRDENPVRQVAPADQINQPAGSRIENSGRIGALSNGDLENHSTHDPASRKFYRGKQLMILQAGSEPGDLIISATAESFRPTGIKNKSIE
jgi:beta-galactosidase